MSTEDEDESIFRALASRHRRRMLDLLKDHPRTTGELCTLQPDLDRCTVMQHLKVLEEAGLVVARRQGRERWNHLNALPIRDIHERWIGPYAAYAVERLGALQKGLDTPT